MPLRDNYTVAKHHWGLEKKQDPLWPEITSNDNKPYEVIKFRAIMQRYIDNFNNLLLKASGERF